jgi:hypothetical protein
MRTAALVALCLVVIPAGVFVYATSQPARHVGGAAAIQQEIADLSRQGVRHITCTRQGQTAAYMCQGVNPSRPGTTYYVLGTADTP